MNQVEKDRFIRWQLDAIEVVDCPTGHSGRLQVGDKVYIHRFDPPDSDEKGFDATIELDETSNATPTVILVAEESDGCWISSWSESSNWSRYLPYITYAKCHKTWEEALHHANTRSEFNKHRRIYFGGSE